jgi:hypothetical protein
MKYNPKVLAPVGLLASFGFIFHLIPSFYKKPEEEKPKSLADILKSSKK